MYRITLFFAIIIINVFCNTTTLKAQTYTYKGTFPYSWKCRPFTNDGTRLLSSEIDAEYQYMINEDTDQRIFSGPFKGYKKMTLKDKNGNPFESSIDISGEFKNDLQDGIWTYKYVYKNTSITCKLNFNNGLLNGTQTLDLNEDGVHTIQNIDFIEGHYAGSYEVTGGSHGYDVHLSFSPEGLPIGNWVISYDNETHKISFDENNKVVKARTIDIRTGDITEWDEKDNVAYTVNRAIRWATLFTLGSNQYNLALMGEHNGNKDIFSLLYPMRKTPAYVDYLFITELPKDEPSKESEQIYTVVDIDAHFPGDNNEFNDWLFQNVKETGYWFGKAGITLDVMSDGSITNINIVKGINGPVDRSLKEAFGSETMPKWIPATINGRNVSQRLTIFIEKPKKPKKK